MKKKNYLYKEPIHKLFRNFISKNLEVQRSQMKVLCFPGYHAWEVSNVYEPSAIPLENIVGIESDRQIYQHLKKTQKFRTIHIDMFDFLRTTDEKFHIISLDFTGYLTKKRREMLSLIGKRDLLEDKAILLTNFQGRREQKSDQAYYKEALETSKAQSAMSLILSGSILNSSPHKEDSLKKMKEFAEKTFFTSHALYIEREDYDLKTLRDTAIPFEVLNSLAMSGVDARIESSKLFNQFLDIVPPAELEPFMEKHGYLAGHYDFLSSFNTRNFRLNLYERMKRNQKTPSRKKEDFLKKYGGGGVFNKIFDYITGYVLGWWPYLVYLVKLYDLDPHIPKKVALYKYESDDGTPMDCDFWSLEKASSVLSSFKKYHERFFEYPLHWWVQEELRKKSIKSLERRETKAIVNFFSKVIAGKEIEDALPMHVILKDHCNKCTYLSNQVSSATKKLEEGKTKRIYIGSFYKPKPTPEEVAKLLIRGALDEEIVEQYRIDNLQLAGYKAALKRGSYDHLKPEIDKESAISFLKQGSSPEEIKKKFRGFSLGQLRAIRAHITMGTYDKTQQEELTPVQPIASQGDIFERIYYLIIPKKKEKQYGEISTSVMEFAEEVSGLDNGLVQKICFALNSCFNEKPLYKALIHKQPNPDKFKFFLTQISNYIDSGKEISPKDVWRSYTALSNF